MRKLTVALALAVSIAALSAHAAGAKEGDDLRVEVAAAPKSPDPGQPFTVLVSYLINGNRPWRASGLTAVVSAQNPKTGEQITAYTTATKRAGVYAAQMKFPDAGKWRYQVTDANGQIHRAQTVWVGGQPGGFSFPTLPVVGVVLGLLVGFGSLFLLARVRRGDAVAVPRQT